MKTQSVKQNESRIRRVFPLILSILMLMLASLPCAAQKKSAETPKVSDVWEIAFGHSYGRYLQNRVFYKINSNGKTYYQKDRNPPIVGEIPAESVAELDELVKKLDLSKVKTIPANEFNACIASPHLPNVNFTLKIADQSYKLRHCNNTKEYGYTLILSASQKETYEQLRQKAIAYVDQTNESIAQTTPFTTASPDASTGRVPSDAELQALLQKTIQDFADAVEAEDFTKFRENASPWYKLTSAERYKEVYGSKIILPALRWTGGRTATFSRPPSIDEFKLTELETKTSKTFVALNLHGSYKDSGKSVKFEIQYNAVGKEWKINVISLSTIFTN